MVIAYNKYGFRIKGAGHSRFPTNVVEYITYG